MGRKIDDGAIRLISISNNLPSNMEKSPTESRHWLPNLLRFWAIFTLITFAIMLTHQSDDAVFLNRYSTLVSLMLGILTFAAVVLWRCEIYLKRHPSLLTQIDSYLDGWRTRRAFAPVIVILSSCLLAFIWVMFLGNHLPTYAFLRMYLAASVCVAALALLYGGRSTSQKHTWKILPFLLIALLGFMVVSVLPYFPGLAKADEAFVFSMARNALETGQYRPQILRQAYPEYYYGGAWIWMMAGWLKVAGISFVAGRLYILFISILSLGFLYLGTRQLFDRLTAWFVVLMGIYAFATLNHIRFDIHCAFWLSVAFFFYGLSQTSKQGWTHLATGFAIGMCIDSNPIAYCFGLGLFLVYAWDYIQQLLREKRLTVYRPFWGLSLGGAIALIVYFQLHSGVAFARDQTTGDMVSFYTALIQSNLATGSYFVQLNQYLFVFLTNQPILFGFMLLGIITAIRERTRADIVLLSMYFTWMAVVVFAYYYFPVFYLTLGLPLFLILAARGVTRGLPDLIGSSMGAASALARTTSILVAIWLCLGLIHGLRQLPSQSIEDVVEVGKQIGEIVPQDATIVAAEAYYFGMLDHRNFVGGVIESTLGAYFGTPPEAVWADIQPDAVVFSSGWPTEPSRSPALLSYMTAENFRLQACYETASYGQIELWSRNVSTDAPSELTCTLVCNPRTGC